MKRLLLVLLLACSTAKGVTVIIGGAFPSVPTSCDAVVVNAPNDGTNSCPQTIGVSTTTSGAVIFYTVGSSATDPTHTGSTATGTTVKINSTSGSFSSGGGIGSTRYVRALAYRSDLTDSIITGAEPACQP